MPAKFDNGSIGLYLIAGAVILFVLGQSLFFLIKAWKHGRKIGIDKKKLISAVTSSALFTIPSALSVLATVIALAPALGLVIPWVRLSVIGNLTYETVAATNAIEAFGITTGISEKITDPEVYAGIAWVMTIGICFSLIILPFVAKPLHKKFLKLNQKTDEEPVAEEAATVAADAAKPKKKRGFAGFVDYVTPALFIGLIGAYVANAILGSGKPDVAIDGAGVLSILTLVTSIAVSIVLELVAKKCKLTWLEPFVMPIGMIAGMVVAVLAYNLPEIGQKLVEATDVAALDWIGEKLMSLKDIVIIEWRG
ncbi:MAG: DUF5058 family protein [Clostridia bacterium]|nr:DUF5058 family protein [Clostridia bacterium]